MRTWQFWAVLATISIIFTSQEFARHLVHGHRTQVPLFVIVISYALPILYSALQLGLLSTVIAAGLATACSGFVAGQELVAGATMNAWADNVQIVIFDIVGTIVGHYAEVAKAARQDASVYASLLISAQEDERRRIARELHDEPVQRLVHLIRLLDRLHEESGDPDAVTAATREARDLTASITASIRDIAQGLRPGALEDLGIETALAILAQQFEERSGTEASLDIIGESAGLDDDLELTIYRIVQEALTNVEKHTHASRVEVRVSLRPREVELTITDSGEGVKRYEDVSQKIGLIGMRERVTGAGGTIRFTTRRGVGTTLNIWLPREAEEVRTG